MPSLILSESILYFHLGVSNSLDRQWYQRILAKVSAARNDANKILHNDVNEHPGRHVHPRNLNFMYTV